MTLGAVSPERSARVTERRRFWIVLLAALVVATGIRVLDVKPAVAQSPVLTVLRSAVDPGLDPTNPLWDDVPSSIIQLTSQKVTPPMSDDVVPSIEVAALHYNDMLYINLRWIDFTDDKRTDSVGVFADAVAVQFPAIAAASVPAICMGQADTAVNIWHWRADSQEGIDLIPADAFVDQYPETDELHYPAIAAGNLMVGAPAVHNLVAGGFGTVTPLDSQTIVGGGSFTGTGWSVTMARPFQSPGDLQPAFQVGGEMDVALAVWDGARGDRNGQKAVSSFLRMEIQDSFYDGALGSEEESEGPSRSLVLLISLLGLVLIAVFAISLGRPRDTEDEQGAAAG